MRRGHGQSALETHKKEAFFSTCLGWHLSVECRGLAANGHPYWHCDLNPGAGYNAQPFDDGAIRGNGCAGTPELMLRRLRQYAGQMSFDCLFVEKNLTAVDALRRRCDALAFAQPLDLFLAQQYTMSIRCERGDNERICREYPEHIRRVMDPAVARGSIISDPNGFSRHGGAVSLDTLATTLRALPYFMFLLRFPAGDVKRLRGVVKNDTTRLTIKSSTMMSVRAFFSLRRYWLISEPVGRTTVFLCGTPYRARPRPDWGLHAADSVEGQAIIAKCETVSRWRWRK